ncbi:hypothetical protein [Novipirellula caenicola]|uniref:Secreted protein n=1 Tax=Novipirellula caenicola TaxID=1536901 RepID=A0ABP9VPV0_9BACT
MDRFALAFLLLPMTLTGCDSKETGAVIDTTDADKVAEYQRLVEESEKQMEEAASNNK